MSAEKISDCSAPPVSAEIHPRPGSWAYKLFLLLFAVVNSSLLSDIAHSFSMPCSLQVATPAYCSNPGFGMSFLSCADLNHPDLPSGSHLFGVWFMPVLLPRASLSSSWEGHFPGWASLHCISSLLSLLSTLVSWSCISHVVTILPICVFHRNKNCVSLAHFCPGFLAHYCYSSYLYILV